MFPAIVTESCVCGRDVPAQGFKFFGQIALCLGYLDAVRTSHPVAVVPESHITYAQTLLSDGIVSFLSSSCKWLLHTALTRKKARGSIFDTDAGDDGRVPQGCDSEPRPPI